MSYVIPTVKIVEGPIYVIQFSGVGLAAGAQITLVSGQISFRYRILKVKVFFGDDAVPDMRYYPMVGFTPGGSTTGLPEGQSIFAPLSPQSFMRAGFGKRECEPNLIVDSDRSYLKIHVQNNDALFAVGYAAEITIRRL